MQHKHKDLIEKYLKDTSIEFEFAYGCGVDFTWEDCGIDFVIKDQSAQIRVKENKKIDIGDNESEYSEVEMLRKENRKLTEMISRGLGWEDMKGGTLEDIQG